MTSSDTKKKRRRLQFIVFLTLSFVSICGLDLLSLKTRHHGSTYAAENFGRSSEVLQQPVQLTSKPGHHWFGYFDKSCGNVNNIVLAMKTKQIKALPPLDELIQIGYINLNLV